MGEWTLENTDRKKQAEQLDSKECCCSLSVGVALNVRFTTNGMCVKNNTHIYVARTSNNGVIMACDLYCCLLPQCDVWRTYHSDFPIATVPYSMKLYVK